MERPHMPVRRILAEELRSIPGVEVELQRPSAVQRYTSPPWPFPPFVYRTTNVVARLPGRVPSALLLDAHFDTVYGTAGAGDDALGVAVMVETLRVLANGPKPEHTLIVNLNGAEEMGLLGAAGFLQHPQAKDVRAYVYCATLRAMGDKVLSLVQGLANGPLPGNVDHTRRVYYDILGRFVLIYSQTMAQVAAAVALLLSGLALTLGIRRGAFSLRRMGVACVNVLLIGAVALCAAVLVALLLAFGLRRPHGWFAQPALAMWSLGGASVAGGLATRLVLG